MERISLREQAQSLRRAGNTYSQIQRKLDECVPRSTLSYWCKGVELPLSFHAKRENIIAKGAAKGRKKAVETNRRKRKLFLEQIAKEAESYRLLMSDVSVSKIALAMLYLGEGGKWESHRGLYLGSSDPDIVQIYIRLLRKCYRVPKSRLRARIVYRADQNLWQLTRFWSRKTGIPVTHFYKTAPDARTKGRPTRHKDYRGVCTIYAPGTDVQLELDAIARLFLRV